MDESLAASPGPAGGTPNFALRSRGETKAELAAWRRSALAGGRSDATEQSRERPRSSTSSTAQLCAAPKEARPREAVARYMPKGGRVPAAPSAVLSEAAVRRSGVGDDGSAT